MIFEIVGCGCKVKAALTTRWPGKFANDVTFFNSLRSLTWEFVKGLQTMMKREL